MQKFTKYCVFKTLIIVCNFNIIISIFFHQCNSILELSLQKLIKLLYYVTGFYQPDGLYTKFIL